MGWFTSGPPAKNIWSDAGKKTAKAKRVSKRKAMKVEMAKRAKAKRGKR